MFGYSMKSLVSLSLLFLLCSKSTNSENRDATCICPYGITKGFEYCGYELVELNKLSSKKVEQTNCKVNEVYHCEISGESPVVGKLCGVGTKCIEGNETLAKEYNQPLMVAHPSLKWCINETDQPKACDAVQCEGDRQYYPNPDSCDSFCQCSNGVPVFQPCPAGLQFNPVLNVCDWPENAGCTSNRN